LNFYSVLNHFCGNCHLCCGQFIFGSKILFP